MHQKSSDPRHQLGLWGEDVALRFLGAKGLRLRERGFQTRWGEIDLICQQGDTIVFVEVKTRSHAWQPSAADSISPAKRRHIASAALSYVKKHRLYGFNLRFDVLLIEGGEIEWIPSAFDGFSHYTL